MSQRYLLTLLFSLLPMIVAAEVVNPAFVANVSGTQSNRNGDRDTINVADYGAKCNGTEDDTAGIVRAIAAAKSGAVVMFPTGGTCTVQAGQVHLYKRVVLNGQGATLIPKHGTTGDLLTVGTDVGGVTPFGDKFLNGLLDGAGVSNLRILDPNNRVESVNGLYLSSVDSFNLSHVSIEKLKGYGLRIMDDNSVREAVFENLSIRQSGDVGKPSIYIKNVPSTGDAHNELFFRGLRLNYCADRCLHVTRGATSGGQGVRLLYVEDFQIEQDPTGTHFAQPATEMVWIEEGGIEVNFSHGAFINSTPDTDAKNWGYPALRLGNDTNGFSVYRTKLSDVMFFNSVAGGIGLQVEGATLIQLSNVSFSVAGGGLMRSMVIGKTTPRSSTIGTVSNVPYVLASGVDFFDDGPAFAAESYRAKMVGTQGIRKILVSRGLYSGRKSYLIATGGNVTKTINLSDFTEVVADMAGATFIIKCRADAGGSGEVVQSAIANFNDTNIVGSVFLLGKSRLNVNLDVNIETVGRLSAGTLSAENGLKVDVVMTNNTGASQTFDCSALRLGL